MRRGRFGVMPFSSPSSSSPSSPAHAPASSSGRRKNTQDSPRKETWAEQLNREPTVESGMRMLNTHYPDLYYTKGAQIQSMLAQKISRQQLNRKCARLWTPMALKVPRR